MTMHKTTVYWIMLLRNGDTSVDFRLGKNLLTDTVKGRHNIQPGDKLTVNGQGRITSIVVKYDDDSGDVRTLNIGPRGQVRDY